MMEQIYHLGGTAAAGILSVAPIEHPTLWLWFLIAAAAAVGTTLREQTQRKPKRAPVLLKPQPPMRRPAPRSPRR